MNRHAPLRVLVGAGSYADAATAVRIARRLFASEPGNLGGVLVEEKAVAALCGIPHQRVISTTGAVRAAPSPTRMHTALMADARAFRRMLEEVASHPETSCSFEMKVGELVVTGIASALTWDLLIFGHREVHRIPGRVVAVTGSQNGTDGSLQTAETLAIALKAELDVYCVGSDASVPPIATPHRVVRFDTIADAYAHLARSNVQAAIVDLAEGPIRSPGDLRRLLDVARCPVVVLSAGRSPLALAHTTLVPPVTQFPQRGDKDCDDGAG